MTLVINLCETISAYVSAVGNNFASRVSIHGQISKIIRPSFLYKLCAGSATSVFVYSKNAKH